MNLCNQCEVGTGFGQFGEPMLTMGKTHLWVNMASLRAMPEALYVLFLIDRAQQVLVLKPGGEDEQRTVRWKTPRGNPRKLACEAFLLRISAMMQWGGERRKILGRIAHDESGPMLVFDLKEQRQPESLGEHRLHPLVKRLEEDIGHAE